MVSGELLVGEVLPLVFITVTTLNYGGAGPFLAR